MGSTAWRHNNQQFEPCPEPRTDQDIEQHAEDRILVTSSVTATISHGMDYQGRKGFLPATISADHLIHFGHFHLGEDREAYDRAVREACALFINENKRQKLNSLRL